MRNVRITSGLCVALCIAVLSAALAARAGDISGIVRLSETGQGIDLTRSVVYLDSQPALDNQPPTAEPKPQIVQRDKAFVPDMLVIQRGTTVEFPNWDPYAHNVFSRSRAAQFDLDRYSQGQSKTYTFEQTGIVQIFCNIHPQMRSVVLVTPNRYFARADAQGRFTLRDVPPGRYVLVGWRERSGEQRLPIELGSSGVRGVVLTLASATAAEPSNSTPAVRSEPAGVERGLGVKREKLNLPVVGDAHPAPGGEHPR